MPFYLCAFSKSFESVSVLAIQHLSVTVHAKVCLFIARLALPIRDSHPVVPSSEFILAVILGRTSRFLVTRLTQEHSFPS